MLCDPNGLENALLDLAINARDAMPGGGTIAVATEDVRLTEADVAGQDGARPGEYVEVSVSDTGAGMDEATRTRAFEPFFTTKPIGQGTGLGLSQVYGFVRQSGGVVRLDSAPGRGGTTVRLYLPRHEPAPGPGERPVSGDEAGAAGAGEAVLLVEDEVGVRAVAAEHLREAGFRVLETGDGPAALRLLRSGARVDLLATDVGLPGGLNGRQVAEAAREGRPGLPVLFITGYAGGALDGRLPPGTAVIGKPFALDALAAKVRAMLEAAPAGRGPRRRRDPPRYPGGADFETRHPRPRASSPRSGATPPAGRRRGALGAPRRGRLRRPGTTPAKRLDPIGTPHGVVPHDHRVRARPLYVEHRSTNASMGAIDVSR